MDTPTPPDLVALEDFFLALRRRPPDTQAAMEAAFRWLVCTHDPDPAHAAPPASASPPPTRWWGTVGNCPITTATMSPKRW